MITNSSDIKQILNKLGGSAKQSQLSPSEPYIAYRRSKLLLKIYYYFIAGTLAFYLAAHQLIRGIPQSCQIIGALYICDVLLTLFYMCSFYQTLSILLELLNNKSENKKIFYSKIYQKQITTGNYSAYIKLLIHLSLLSFALTITNQVKSIYLIKSLMDIFSMTTIYSWSTLAFFHICVVVLYKEALRIKNGEYNVSGIMKGDQYNISVSFFINILQRNTIKNKAITDIFWHNLNIYTDGQNVKIF